MFVPEAPFYVNYAAIGLGIGHEITHGYDDLGGRTECDVAFLKSLALGAQYDDLGNLRMWWNYDTMETFLRKRQCFINQYSNRFEPITQRSVGQLILLGPSIAS